MAKLLVQETTGAREFEIIDAETHIGRELDNAVRISDPSISRHHALLRKTEAGYDVVDLQSSNGVLLNGTRVQSAALQDGDRITLGQIQITFVNPVSAAMLTNPLGTVRMNPADMAKLQAIQAGIKPVPENADSPATAHNPSPVSAPVNVPEPSPSPQPALKPAPAAAPQQAAVNPAPEFLAKFLPPIPDDAKPTGERGDFVTRFLAILIDAAVPIAIGIACSIITMLIGPVAGCLSLFVNMIVGIGYNLFFIPWCWIKFGASPGKKIMKLRIVPEGNPAGRIDVATAVLRMVGHLVNGMLLCLPYLIILGSERKGLQDIISKSLVIKVDR